jgi:DNA-directed RNA polymerase specialized sigma24 family protein
MHYLAANDVGQKIQLLRTLHLERNIYYAVIQDFLKTYTPVRKALNRYVKTHLRGAPSLKALATYHNVLTREGASQDVYAAIPTVTYWSKLALQMRDMIVGKYTKFALNRASLHYRNQGAKIDFEDLVQNFMAAAYKAVDKFNPERGTLTNYITNWMMDARSRSDHEYGTAYDIPRSKKAQIARHEDNTVNISTSLDADSVREVASGYDVEEDFIQKSEVAMVRRVAKLADPTGIARFMLEIEECLSPAEVALLKTAAC